ncbi:MAG: ATP-binding cassette domain-containing protein [Bdellovibrionota bacterium]
MLELQNISKNFYGVKALDDVSLKLESGVVLAIVGDNGAGKSTLMKCVSAVISPDSGAISFNNQGIQSGNPASSKQAGIEMIYQDLSLCKLQDVVQNVFLGSELTKGLFLDRQSMIGQCNSVFKSLDIDIPKSSVVGSLSGGQQQSVAIARAMLRNPKLLIMDEPTAALAVKETQKVLEHILKVRDRGVSVIMITHNLQDVFEVADRILVMKQGRISYDITPQETSLEDLTGKIISG